ncbi:MAG TPA: GLUG motif-containing protein, partial [Rhizomicrobium sp.]|nr:GLUG motif-containing protein [Rhizomicrobium sp.]
MLWRDAGGLVGDNEDAIENSYARGDASGFNANVGGLVGFNGTTGTIQSSYSTGYVSGDDIASHVGGFSGDNENSTLTDFVADYWDKTTSGTNTAIGYGTDSVPQVTGKK